MTNLRSKLIAIQHVVAFVAYVGATLMHEEAALVGLLTVPLVALKLTRGHRLVVALGAVAVIGQGDMSGLWRRP